MEGQRVAMVQDIGRMLSQRHRFETVCCPACQSNHYQIKFEKYGLTIAECQDCKTLFTNPRPTAAVLDEFYKGSVNYAYWNKHIFPASEDARRQRIFVPRVDKTLAFCQKYQVPTNTLLEVGAAFGTYCVEMQSRQAFNRVVAVEPTPGLAETCRQKGLEVIEETIENIHFDPQDRFDVVVNFEVIEHLYSPKDFVMHLKKVLKPGGLLLLTCPNGRGFDFTVLGEKCNSMDHEHLNYFNPQSLGLLLQNCGFNVLETQTPGLLDAELVRKKVLAGEFSLHNQPFLQQVLIDEWETQGQAFQSYLQQAGLSSNMWIVAQLPGA